MKYAELKRFILKEMRMAQGRNYQPVMIKTLNQNNGIATTKQIKQALGHANGKPENYFDNSPVFEVLTKQHPVARYNKNTNLYELLDYDTFTPAEKAWITMYCDEKIVNNTDLKYWVWSVTPENWEIVKAKNIWASKIGEKIRERIKPHDKVIFYVIGTGQFKGIFQFKSNWYDAKEPVWADEKYSIIYHSQIELQLLNLGFVNVYDIAPDLQMFPNPQDKRMINLVLQGGSGYPSNNGKPISMDDYLVISNAMKTTLRPRALENLEQLIQKFDKNRNYFNPDRETKEEREKNRLKFISKFPPQKISEMKLEDYVAGKPDPVTGGANRTTFSYYLEFGIPGYGGVGGTPASKFGIYFDRAGKNYVYNTERFSSPNEAFNSIKSSIQEMLAVGSQFLKDDGWDEVSKIVDKEPHFISSHIRSKILAVYFPKHCLDIHSRQAVDLLLEYFDIPYSHLKGKLTLKQSKLLEIKNSHLIMQNWSIQDYSHFIWQTIVVESKSKLPKTGHVEYLTVEEFEKFLNAVPKLEAFNQPGQKPPMSAKQFQLLFRILYGSALKIFDALNIRVKDLDLDNRIIRFGDSRNKFLYATILPTDVSYLKEHISTLQKDDNLFDVHRATLWHYAKQIGNLAGLKIFRGKEERETEGMDLLIFRESRAMHMSLDGARDGLIRRKLRVDFSNAVLRYDQPTIEELKEWELKNSGKPLGIMPQIETFDDKPLPIPTQIETFDDKPLPIPTQEEMKAGFAKINEELLVPDEKIAEIVTSLASGRHVLLAGPIGTGKTRLAKIIPEIFWEKVGGYYSEDHTATADWNTQDVIGGIFPKMDNGSPTYDIQNGCVVETVSKNWSNGVNGGKRIPTVNSSRSSSYAGTWLTIDEFNRADIDKAFGQLFTSLRTRSLKIPTDEKGKSFKELPIPKDFRIIGTLNTADKHFLFQLSDALKSRFAYIEIDIPNRKDRDKEIYYAMKNALDELDLQDFSALIALDHTNKKIDIKKSNSEFYQNVLYAYNFLDTVRVFKKLGTAILKLIYQNLLVGTKMSGNSKNVLDNSLSSTLVSQLENMSVAEIGAIRALNSNKVVEYFQKANANPNKQSFVDSLRKTLEYLVISNKENLVSSFSKGNIKGNESDEWNIIKTAYDKKKPELQLELSKMEKSMNDLMKTLVI